jgi:sulfatase maturation enzyme AslB (radical SAM superfamily)
MQNNFCKALSNAISFRIPGDTNTLTFNPCCLFDKYLPFTPVYFHRKRKQWSEAETFLPECSKCELKEQTHGMSLRTVTDNQIPNGIDDSIYKLEIVLDTTCNAACIQCGDWQSSLWRKEMADQKRIIHIQPEQQINDKIQVIKDNVDISKVLNWHFWGGEPLLTDTHLKFLRDIKDPSQVSINYTTNGSIFPDEDVLELWSKFKEVRLGISIDGVDEQFHYIRWPLKWDKVVRNIERFRTEVPGNVAYHINCCIIPLNVYYVDILGEWLDKNFSTNPNGSKISYNFIRGEGTLDIGKTPMSLREEVWKRLGEEHVISNVLKELPEIDSGDMLKHLDVWDKHRKLDWRKLFPDAAKHF